MKKYKIAIIIPYFGKWPEWVDLFFYSCMQNSEIDFLIYTDCEKPKILESSSNVHYKEISFDDYSNFVSHRLKIDFHPQNPYKICGLRPFFGFVHQDDIKDYDFWGFGDVDLVLGDIKKFYSDALLEKHDVLSTHADHISGHFTILRNTEKYRNICFNIKDWKDILESEKIHGLDEGDFTYVLFPALKYIQYIRRIIRKTTNWKGEHKFYANLIFGLRYFFHYKKELYFKEQYTTPYLYDSEIHAKNNETEWIYKDGKIYNEKTKKEHIYFHFMFYKKNLFSEVYCWERDFYHLSDKYDNVHIGVDGFNYIG